MKILVLDATTKVLKADLAANPTTNPDYVISYADVDSSTFTEGSADGALTGTTSATLLTGLGSGSKRIVKSISIHNRDSNTITVYLKLDNNGTVRIIEKIVLAAGEAWHNDTQAGGGGTGRPGGSDTQVQFNDGSAFGGDSDLTYNKTTNTLTGVNINATTIDTTNLEVTNIKAKDGVSAVSIADSTGIVTVSTQLQVDNINVSTNTISSTDANGNIILAPNGTGTVKETVSSTNYNIVSQYDIGTAPNKIPINQYLGDLAYQDSTAVTVGSLTASGNIILSTAGAGIDFSATANSSGTMTSELLSDYEEGTFTPSFTSTGISAVTYGTGRNGYYTKVGRLVTVMINIMTDSVTVTNSSAPVTITGLPFTSANLTESRSAVSVGTSARFASNPPGAGVVITNTTTVELYRSSTAYTTASDPTQITAGDFVTSGGNNNTIRMIATYMAA